MNTYKFVALTAKGKKICTMEVVGNKLPSHLEICLAIVQFYDNATQYAMIGCNGEQLEPIPINLKRYVPHEFYKFFESVNFRWIGRHFQYTKGFHKGERGEILNYNQDRNGCYLSVEMESGSYAHIGTTEIGCITVTD